MTMLRPGANRPGEIAPIAGVGENILLKRNDKFTIYKVLDMEGILPSQASTYNFGALAANATSSSISLSSIMEMDRGLEEQGNNGDEIGHFRFRCLDDIRFTLNQRRQDPRFITKSIRTTVSLFSRIHDPSDHLSEVFVLGDDYPYVDVTNPTDYALVTARVVIYGFRYKVQRAETFASPLDVAVPYAGIMGEGF